MNMEELRYPIGRFKLPEAINANQLKAWKSIIAAFPAEIKALTQDLSPEELGYKYRPEGWSIQQLVHHCADSHMNGFIRHKLTLSEDTPQIKPYIESLWAEMPDTLDVEIEASLKIIEGLHKRWGILLNSINEAELKRSYIHPEHGMHFTLYQSIANYAWHCQHHLAHINNALQSRDLY